MQYIPLPRPLWRRTRDHRHHARVVLALLNITLCIEVHVMQVGEGILDLGFSEDFSGLLEEIGISGELLAAIC